MKKKGVHVILHCFHFWAFKHTGTRRRASTEQPLDQWGAINLTAPAHFAWAAHCWVFYICFVDFVSVRTTMAKSMSLLWAPGSVPCWRVMITLEEKKLQGYKHKPLSFEKGEHKSQEVLDINPRGQVGVACSAVKRTIFVLYIVKSNLVSCSNKTVSTGLSFGILSYSNNLNYAHLRYIKSNESIN